LQLTNNPGPDLRPVWSADGQQIAFQSSRGRMYQIYAMNSDGAGERLLSTADVDDRHPAWSPDGRRIAIDSGTETAREIWTIDVADGSRTRITRLGALASFPSWRPDGSQISFYAYQHGVLDLWVVAADGTSARRLSSGIASEQKSQCTFACHAAAWSPDGSRLAYATADRSQVWTLRASDGADEVQVSPNGDAGHSHFPSYLADGRLLYVTEHVTPGRAWTDVWAAGSNASEPRQVVLEDVQAQGPFAFSADGKWMLFASPRSGNFDIYRVPLDQEGQAAMKIKSA